MTSTAPTLQTFIDDAHMAPSTNTLEAWLSQAVSAADPALLIERLARCGDIRSGKGAAAAFVALTHACKTHQPDMSRILLQAGLSHNYCSAHENDETPLIVASYHGDTQTLKLLLTAGAEPAAFNKANETALAYAAKYGHADCLLALLQAGVSLDNGYISRNYPPMLAIAAGHHICLSVMIDAGLALNGVLSNSLGELNKTPLGVCAFYGKIDCARVLIQAGADPNVLDPHGNSPLMWAAANLNRPMIDLLLDAGANPCQRSPVRDAASGRFSLFPSGLDCAQIARTQPFSVHDGTFRAEDLAEYFQAVISRLDLQDATPVVAQLGSRAPRI